MLPTEFSRAVKSWLNARGISDEVLMHNNISVVNGEIVIPIYDTSGNFLFNKYRRSPFSEDGPKYRYDKGATAALYNVQNIWHPKDSLYIVEGELDALALQSLGFSAVSTTGGSGTFNEEWAQYGAVKDQQIYICYDNDDAGIAGTIKLLKIFPFARVILIPKEDGVKDVTDFLLKHRDQWIPIVNDAHKWPLPEETTSLVKTEIKKTIDSCHLIADQMLLRRQTYLEKGWDTSFLDRVLEFVRNRYDFYNHKYKYKRQKVRSGDSIAKARAVPITEYIQFDRQSNAKCINHTDKHPSMHYFKKNNKVKCFPCGFNGDTIDVVRILFNLTASEAIKKINGTA